VRQVLAVRPEERHDTWTAFFSLFGFIGSLAILEAARDALFLSKVPAARLPWTYIAIAVVSLAATKVQSGLARRLGSRFTLGAWTLTAGIVTVGFWGLLKPLGAAGVYALYVWSGVVTSLVLVHFWTLVGGLFSLTQAKRLYGIINAGSVLGALAGSGVATLLAQLVPPRGLLLAAGIGLVLTAFVPAFFSVAGVARGTEAEEPASAPALADSAGFVARQQYARRVVGMLFVAAACLTVADFVFKSTAAAFVPRAQLARWLTTVYFALNAVSLVCQLTLTRWILRRFSVTSALAVLPVLLASGGLALVLGGGLGAALFIKGVDGSLRYSLHRTGSELLFMPFGDEARRRVRAFIDVVGQRGGQALASIGLLALGAWGAPRGVLAVGLVLLAFAWIGGSMALRAPYLRLFRSQLRGRTHDHAADFPALDVASLETLVAALDSDRNAEVLAALDVLEREKRAHLIPALILYHPAVVVVEHALTIFTRAHRKNVVPVIDRLLDHPSPRVRAATAAARSVLHPDAQPLLMRMSLEEVPEVRATIAVNLIASGEIFGEDARERIQALIDHGAPGTQIALVEAIARRGARGFNDVLVKLAAAHETDVRVAAAWAMGSVSDACFIPSLVELLAEERTRDVARQVLVGCGDAARDALVEALEDGSRRTALRWRIPQVIALFEHEGAAEALVRCLARERDGGVRFQIIRALDALVRRHTDLKLDRAVLGDTIAATVKRAYRYLDRRTILARGAREDPARGTRGHEALVRTARDKEKNAVDRLFRLLGLSYPLQDFPQIYRGLVSRHRDARASALELVGNVLDEPLRGAVVGLVDDAPDEERLAQAGRYHRPIRAGYEDLLGQLLDSNSESVRCVTLFHIGELRLVRFRERLRAMGDAQADAGAPSDVARVLALLDAGPIEATA
jgi:ATP:ADP antiporter, AAA family